MTDAVLFDLDGTLWDSVETVTQSWNHTIQRRTGMADRLRPADIHGIMGLTSRQIADALFADFGACGQELCLACLAEECTELAVLGGRIYDGTEDMLRALSERFPLFIVSNCQKGYIEAFLHFSGFGRYFTAHRCEGGTGLCKADNLKMLIRDYKLNCPVYVGDTETDEASAAQAGCRFIHAAYGFGTAKRPAARAQSPAEISALILNEFGV